MSRHSYKAEPVHHRSTGPPAQGTVISDKRDRWWRDHVNRSLINIEYVFTVVSFTLPVLHYVETRAVLRNRGARGPFYMGGPMLGCKKFGVSLVSAQYIFGGIFNFLNFYEIFFCLMMYLNTVWLKICVSSTRKGDRKTDGLQILMADG